MATITSVGSGLWSAAGTWDAGVPVDNDVVVIASGHTVEFDVDQSGFANGIAGITVTGTLSLTRTAGTYHLKMKAATTIAGAGTFDCGTSVSGIPFATKHTITGGAAWYINGAAGLTMTVYGAEPVTKYVKLTALEPIGETVLAVDTDVTGDIWAAGDTIRVVNINKTVNTEERTIDAGGIAAGSITVTAGLTAAKIAGSYVALITRNVNFILNGANMIQSVQNIDVGGGQFTSSGNYRIFFSGNNPALSGGTFTGGHSVIANATKYTISGGVFIAALYPIFSSAQGVITDCFIGGASYFSFTACVGLTIHDGVFAGSTNGFTVSGITILAGYFVGNGNCIRDSFGTLFGGQFIGNSYASRYCRLQIINVENSNDVDYDACEILAYNVSFSATEVSDYTALPRESYSYSIDHDQVQGAFRSWTKGGITTKQAITVPTGYTSAYQTVLEDASNEGYWQKEQAVAAGQSVNLDLWLRKSASMVYLPRVQVFLKRSTDPFAGGTPLKTFTMTDSIDTFENDTYTYSNDGTEDETLVIRFQGKNASGNMFSALTITVLNVDLTEALARLAAIKTKTDQLVFTVANQVDANALTGGTSAVEIREEMDDNSTQLAAIKTKTDQLTFTQPNKVDAYLTMTAAQIISAVSGSSITDIRGNSWIIVIEDLSLSSDKQQFAIKATHRNAALNQSAPAWNVSTPDADAVLFIDSDTGLLYLNGDQVTDPTLGSLVYAGTTLTLTLKPAVTALLPPGTYTYGIQSVDALGAVSEVYGGTFVITADVVRSIT